MGGSCFITVIETILYEREFMDFYDFKYISQML